MGELLHLEDTSTEAINVFVERIRAAIGNEQSELDWEKSVEDALHKLGRRGDLPWARLVILLGGQRQRISGAPMYVGRWIGIDPEAVAIARTRGDEDDYCSTLFVYDWWDKEDAEDLVRKSRGWKKKPNIGRALSVAAETMMYRHGSFERACEILDMQLALHEGGVRGHEISSIVEQAKSLVRMTMARLASGELANAIETRDRAKEMVDRLGPGFIIYEHAGTKSGGDLYPEISMESNFAWYVGGNWQAVADHWVYAIGLDEPGGSPVHVIEAAMAAQAYARLGSFENAHRILRQLTPILKELKPRDWGVNGAVGRSSHAIWDIGAVEYADDHRELALSLLEAGVGDWTNTSLELTVARHAALLGRAEEAMAYFGKARDKLVRKSPDPRAAIIDFDEAKAIRLLGNKRAKVRSDLLAAADHVFRALDMRDWSARAAQEGERS